MLANENGKKILSRIPIDRLLLESDMPFVIPDSYPNNLYLELKRFTQEIVKLFDKDIVDQIANNSRKLFAGS